MKSIIVIIAVSMLSACSTVATVATPEATYAPTVRQSDVESLFNMTEDGLTSDQIERMLNHRLTLPKQMRLAVVKLPGGGFSRGYFGSIGTSRHMAQASEVVLQLRDSSRLYDASFLPRLLLPKERSVSSLRAAAARYRADLLMVYQPNCNTFHQIRAFRANRVKANCAVELVLLDIRTGLIPFSVVATQAFSAQKSDDDLNFNETVSNAEQKAINEALQQATENLVKFIDATPLS